MGLRIPGHREKILAEVKPGSTPCFLNIGWYWMMNLLGLSLCFRWYFTSISGRRDFNLIKRIQKSVPIMQTWFFHHDGPSALPTRSGPPADGYGIPSDQRNGQRPGRSPGREHHCQRQRKQRSTTSLRVTGVFVGAKGVFF